MKRIDEMTREELVALVGNVFHYLFVTTSDEDDETLVIDPDKEWDGDTWFNIAEEFEAAGLVPDASNTGTVWEFPKVKPIPEDIRTVVTELINAAFALQANHWPPSAEELERVKATNECGSYAANYRRQASAIRAAKRMLEGKE